VKQQQLSFEPVSLDLQPGDPLGVACFAVALLLDAWEHTSRWRSSPAAVLVLNALVPLQAPCGEGRESSLHNHPQQQQQQQQDQPSAVVAYWRDQLRLLEELKVQPSGQPGFR